MIRYQITGANPIDMNVAAKLLLDHPLLNVESDSGNRNGRKSGYIRYVHTRIRRKAETRRKARRLDGAQKMSLATRCWQNIVHNTDTDGDAVKVIVKLIEYVEKLCP